MFAVLLPVVVRFVAAASLAERWEAPPQAQVIDQKTFNALENVTAQDKFDGSSVGGLYSVSADGSCSIPPGQQPSR